jgi:acetyl-CoA carboxylase biotin carboxyl carrier protein
LADVCSEVSGSIWKIEFKVGDKVASGDVLIIVESMKMEIPVEAPRAGVVSAIRVQEGDAVTEGQVLLTLT